MFISEGTLENHYCQLTEGFQDVRPYGHPELGIFQAYISWSDYYVQITVGQKNTTWNYIDEDIASVNITILSDEEIAVLQNFDFQQTFLDTDIEFRMQADGTVNPSGTKIHPWVFLSILINNQKLKQSQMFV